MRLRQKKGKKKKKGRSLLKCYAPLLPPRPRKRKKETTKKITHLHHLGFPETGKGKKKKDKGGNMKYSILAFTPATTMQERGKRIGDKRYYLLSSLV